MKIFCKTLRVTTRTKTTLRMTVAAVLSNLLVVSTCAPFSVGARSFSSTKPILTIQQQSVAPYRDHELLVRFRAGTSELVKDTIFASQGARRKKQLRGESGVETLELRTGRDVKTAALELLLNPIQVNLLLRTCILLLDH